MVDRIRALLAERQLTPTQFADFIGVGRPIISHILSGRNKPSLEVIQKVINAFPDLALPWLLTGVGAMWTEVEAAKPVPGEKTAKKTGARPPSAPATPLAAPAAAPLTAPVPVPAVAEPAVALNAAPATPILAPVEAAPLNLAATAPGLAPMLPVAAEANEQCITPKQAHPLQALAEPDKAIRRIVIFYQDGTFSAFQPE